ncbi:MAG: glycosyltransferase, partial [Nitrospirota bacterium]
MILQEISGYDSNRFNASVCCMKEGGEIAKSLEAAGYAVNILHKMKGHGFDFSLIKAIIKIIKKKNIHILRTHQYHANLYGRIAGTLARVPVIIPTFHNVYESPNRPKLHRRIFNSILARSSDALIGVSESVASDIKKFDMVNSQKVKVIYNGIDLKKFRITISKAEARRLFGFPEDSIIIGAIGRLTEQKGHRYLIEAAARLQGSCLVIAGDGPLMEDLKSISNANNVNCIFTGRISPQKAPLFLKSLDIFSFPSLWEGLPVALVEAMASGHPVIS